MTTPPPITLDPDQVQVGTPNGPGVYLAEVGTAPPTDTTSPWGAGWQILGYLSDDGPTIGQNTSSDQLTPAVHRPDPVRHHRPRSDVAHDLVAAQ